MAAHNWIGQVDVCDDGLEFATVLLRDLATENDREFVGLTDCAIRIQQPIANSIECCTAREDQIVAVMCPSALCARSISEASIAWTLGPHAAT